ncbi:MAG TPA: glycosyltransferase family 4 protein [Gaiellaceae bacterium]
MRTLIVTGIWPPDVGGPASHAPEAAAALRARGHEVAVLTTASSPPAPEPYPVHWVSRRLPPGLRHLAVAARVARLSARADVVYATSMVGRSAFASRAPLVVKVAGDPAFERARRRGLYGGLLADFQTADAGVPVRLLRLWRTLTLRRARRLLTPSVFLRDLVVSWGIDASRVSVLPNPAPPLPTLPPRDEVRRSLGVDGPMLAFAGRLTPAKALELAFVAVELADGVTFLVAGDGELRAELERRAGPSVRFLGPLERGRVLELLAAADAVLLSSSWENFPHVLVEALAAGTPVIATRVGGVPEIVEDGVNGLLVEPNDAAALAAAIRRFFGDDELRALLRSNAASSVERFSPAAVFDELDRTLRA